ncbi:MAG TPA: YXWGXW repeat-containing protein [Bryobacteraceae bacterium]|jgi:hypothetical protein|nr:YXWGXW repeat-containing protein [Bryobacteraceae bacterium]
MRTAVGLLILVWLTTQALAYAEVIVIKSAPPPPVSVVVVGRAPYPGYVWRPGYYRGLNGRYVWVAGAWVRPPRYGMVWVPPLWRKGPNGFIFVAGRWR